MPDDTHKPEWTPDDAGDAFASRVMRGVVGGHDGMALRPGANQTRARRQRL